jgi:hypothetical protein
VSLKKTRKKRRKKRRRRKRRKMMMVRRRKRMTKMKMRMRKEQNFLLCFLRLCAVALTEQNHHRRCSACVCGTVDRGPKKKTTEGHLEENRERMKNRKIEGVPYRWFCVLFLLD